MGTSLSTLLAVLCTFVPISAQQTETPRDLKFINSSVPLGWARRAKGMGVLVPTHVAVFVYRVDKDRKTFGRSDLLALFRNNRERFSSETMTFMGQNRYFGFYKVEGGHFRIIVIYGTSEKDVRNAARLYISELDKLAATLKQNSLESRRNLPGIIAEAKKHISELERELSDREDEYREVGHSYDSIEHVKECLQTYRWLNESLHVEIAGIQAKLKASRTNPTVNPDTEALRQHLVDLETSMTIELIGSKARKHRLAELHEVATNLLKLSNEKNKLGRELRNARSSLDKDQQELAWLRDLFVDGVPVEMQPLSVHGNTVTIYPVDTETHFRVPEPVQVPIGPPRKESHGSKDRAAS